mmetsp:Transcript_3441/g.4917  ORF Transcript_3441/g.4917 Transcript_3441/m.4917 type:complete len:230 (-) Transcript_3441:183-872(-)
MPLVSATMPSAGLASFSSLALGTALSAAALLPLLFASAAVGGDGASVTAVSFAATSLLSLFSSVVSESGELKSTSSSSSKPSSSSPIRASIKASGFFGAGGEAGISGGFDTSLELGAGFDEDSNPRPNSSPMLKAFMELLMEFGFVFALSLAPLVSLPAADSAGASDGDDCFGGNSRLLPIVGPERGKSFLDSSFTPPLFSISASFFMFSSRLLAITSQNRESRCNILS